MIPISVDFIDWNEDNLFIVFLHLTLCICRFSPFSSSSLRISQNIGEFAAKKHFTGYGTANTIPLSVAIEINFFWPILTSGSKGNSSETTW